MTLSGHAGPVECLAFSPDGKLMASAADGAHPKPGEIILWTFPSGKEVARLPGHQTYLRGMAFSPDGSKLAVGGAEAFTTGRIKVWDVATRKERFTLAGPIHVVFGGLAFSPDGKRLASAGHTLKLWDMATGLEVMSFPNAGRSVAFSPNGHLLAAGGATGPNDVHEAQVLLWKTR